MKTILILFAIVAASSAASILTMDDGNFEKVMMEHLASQGSWVPVGRFRSLMDETHQQSQKPEALEAEEAEDNQKEVAAVKEDLRPVMTGAVPYAANRPCRKTGSISNNRKPAAGNGKRQGGGSAAAASAISFSRGSNSFSSSRAQAFTRGSK